MNNNLQKILIKLDRISAWFLFVIMIIYAISGYGMTKGIIDLTLARSLHLIWLAPIALLSFVIHTAWAIHLAFKRWNFWNLFSKTILFLFYFFLVFGLIYIDQFYTRNAAASLQQLNSNSALLNVINSQSQIEQQMNQNFFTLAELKKYDGSNGNPAYVAVDGLVYDLSSVFASGYHHGYKAGQDLTRVFNNQHDKSVLNRFNIVGKLIN